MLLSLSAKRTSDEEQICVSLCVCIKACMQICTHRHRLLSSALFYAHFQHLMCLKGSPKY